MKGTQLAVRFALTPAGIAIVGSRGGMPTDPHWARNLRANLEARAHREIPVFVLEFIAGSRRA